MEQGIQDGTGKQASQPNWKAGWGDDVTSPFEHSQKGTFSLCRMRGHFGCALTPGSADRMFRGAIFYAEAMAFTRFDRRDSFRATVLAWITPLPAARCISGCAA